VSGEDQQGRAQQEEHPPEPGRVNLFTISAMRLHLSREGIPPTPGKEPSVLRALHRSLQRRARALLDGVRERLLGR
jgi:hypothetical protein